MTDLNDPVVRGYLIQIVGEEGLGMIEKMPPGEVTDEQIAQETEIMLNVVRRTLFVMNENKLAICRRERDSSSGWLTYLWQLDLSDVESQLNRELKRLTRNLQIRLDFEEDNVFYKCPEGCVRMKFNDATSCEFLCQECGEDLVFDDNEKMVNKLKIRLNELKMSQ